MPGVQRSVGFSVSWWPGASAGVAGRRPILRRSSPSRVLQGEGASGILEVKVPANSRQRVEVADYDPAWPVLFGETGSVLRAALGAVALRKRRLAGRFRYDGAGYTDAKNPYVWGDHPPGG